MSFITVQNYQNLCSVYRHKR